MIRYYEGTVFNAGADAIVNTVNCEGAMGAGLALEFMLRYPKMYEDYTRKCQDGEIRVGKVDYFVAHDGHTIINFPTKWLFRYPSRIEWIDKGLQDFLNTFKQYDFKSVAFPKLGASNGGLEWLVVKEVMEEKLQNADIDVVICTDTMKHADGIEKEMLDCFNGMEEQSLKDVTRLTSRQLSNIKDNRPYDRFWKISKTPSIGTKTYCELFNYFYKRATDGNEDSEQLSFL